MANIFGLLIWLSLANSIQTGCEIYPFRPRAPLVINSNANSIIYPQHGKTTIEVSINEHLHFSCPGSNIIKNEVSLGSLVSARCNGENIFNIEGLDTNWNNLQCLAEPVSTVREIKTFELDGDNPNINCFNDRQDNLKLLQIGFQIHNDIFIELIDVCFDTLNKVPVYSYYNISASINSRAANVRNPFFEQDDEFYRIGNNIHHIYKQGAFTVNQLLGLPPDSKKYINGDTFINKGHLAAKTDFIYEPLQKATFRYINVSPQWSSFNGGNWNQVEIDVRDYAARMNLDLKVWTGVYGHSVLPHEKTLEPQELYLYVNDRDSRHSPSFPVPAVFWKLVYDSRNRRGIILVGHNNPYELVTNYNQIICERDVSNQVNWLRWFKEDIVRGYSYACDWYDRKFRSLIHFLPLNEVDSLLA